MRNFDEITDEVFRRRDDFETAQKQQKQTARRRINATLTALMIFVAVAGTVGFAAKFISGTELFKEYFQANGKIDLSEAQDAIIEERVIEVQESVTKDDITVTLDGVLIHRGAAYVYMTLNAPEEISLEHCNASGMIIKNEKGSRLTDSYALGTLEYDSETNTMKYMLRGLSPRCGTSVYQRSGGEITIVIPGFIDGSNDQPISESIWEFTVPLTPPEESYVDVLTEPVICEMEDHWSGEKAEIQINALRLYELSVDLEFQVLNGVEFRTDPRICVVLTDGTEIFTNLSGTDDNHTDSDKLSESYFESPIVAEAVDYIRIGTMGSGKDAFAFFESARIDFPQQ